MDSRKGLGAVGKGKPVLASTATDLLAAALCALTAAGTFACQRELSPYSQRPPRGVRSASQTAAPPTDDTVKASATAPIATMPAVATIATVATMTAKIGVALGGLPHGPGVASAAVLRARSGSVAVRRTGEQLFADVGIETRLFPGDQIMTGDGARAMLVVADETVIELWDSSAVVIGNPVTAASPAASAGVLSGVARFSVSPRAPGEGPFLTFAGGGIVAAVGKVGNVGNVGSTAATFAIGVAAPGLARIGVESGTVEVAAATALKKPVSVASGESVTLDAASGLSRPSPFPDDDWAGWRPAAERRVPVERWAREQAQRVPALQTDIDRASGDLIKVAAHALELAAAQAAEDPTSRSARRRYKQAAPDCGAAIEATFRLSIELQRLNTALLSETYSLEKQLARNPVAIRASSATAAPLVLGALLYNKKVQIVADTTVAPIRPLYFVHHPSGRRQASAVGVDVPAFFAETPLDPVPTNLIDGLVKRDTYAPPATGDFGAAPATRTVTLGPVRPDWDAWLVVPPAPAREVSWYAPAEAGRQTAEADSKFRASARSPAPGHLKTAH